MRRVDWFVFAVLCVFYGIPFVVAVAELVRRAAVRWRHNRPWRQE